MDEQLEPVRVTANSKEVTVTVTVHPDKLSEGIASALRLLVGNPDTDDTRRLIAKMVRSYIETVDAVEVRVTPNSLGG